MSSYPFLLATLIGAVSACGGDSKKDDKPSDDTGTVASLHDADGDGVTVGDGDCDDEDAAVHPGRPDACNGQDDNCNGVIDEGHSDVDGDDIADCVDVEDCDALMHWTQYVIEHSASIGAVLSNARRTAVINSNDALIPVWRHFVSRFIDREHSG